MGADDEIDQYVHQGAAVLRTPLLPFDVLLECSSDKFLPRLLNDPDVREALFLASPTLDAAVDAWLCDPGAPRARDLELAVGRYLIRMASRPTPFGLFAGCMVVSIGDSTTLTVCPPHECRRHTRLDMNYITQLAEALERTAIAGERFLFRPNTSIVIDDDELRYVETRTDAITRSRTFHLVSVERTQALATALCVASRGAKLSEIAASITRQDGSLALSDASAFVDELVDAQILESNIVPAITCESSLRDFVSTLRATNDFKAVGEHLGAVHDELRAIDNVGLGVSRERYRAIVSGLSQLPVAVDPARLFQVDLFRPDNGSSLSSRFIHEVRNAVSLLHRLTPVRGTAAMRQFRERFVQRYGGGREIPLGEALDEERGIGFPHPHGATTDPGPLLDGIPLPRELSSQAPSGPQERWKLRRLLSLLERGAREWVLDAEDIDALTIADRAPLPDAFAAMVTVAARSDKAIDERDFRLRVHHVLGPSGATFLGRFCDSDPDLRALVERHIQAEQRCRPDAIFAEIVHLPEGRLGNVICRPVLRSHEIPYLGRSGLSQHRQISIDDLLVSVHQGKVRLRSRSLNREILPRLTSAHNHYSATPAVYRFLCDLQYEGMAYSLEWKWGMLADAPFLPRVRHGETVLSLARWTLDHNEIKALAEGTSIREARALPRWICVAEGDNLLPLDLDGTDARAHLLALTRNRKQIRLQELFPTTEELCVTGEKGRYTHELIIPFVRAQVDEQTVALPRIASCERTFLPGSEWLSIKVYAGPATSDLVLRSIMEPLVHHLRAKRLIKSWFFLRFADPELHIRVRFLGEPEILTREVLPELHKQFHSWVVSNRVTSLQIDTYEREVERYGGARGILISERIFEADSDATLAVLRATAGDEGADLRWRLAFYGMGTLLDAAALDDAAREKLLRRFYDACASELQVGADTRHSLGTRYRNVRAELEHLLRGACTGPLRQLLPIMDTRTRALVPALEQLRALRDAGELQTPWQDLILSLLHMHVNRLIRTDHRGHELVLCDFLLRTYKSAAERRKRHSSG